MFPATSQSVARGAQIGKRLLIGIHAGASGTLFLCTHQKLTQCSADAADQTESILNTISDMMVTAR